MFHLVKLGSAVLLLTFVVPPAGCQTPNVKETMEGARGRRARLRADDRQQFPERHARTFTGQNQRTHSSPTRRVLLCRVERYSGSLPKTRSFQKCRPGA